LKTLKSKGYLINPPETLNSLLKTSEEHVVTTYNNAKTKKYLFLVMDSLSEAPITTVGCEAHWYNLTKSVMKFYLIMRIHFLCNTWNKKVEERKKKTRDFRKQAHLA